MNIAHEHAWRTYDAIEERLTRVVTARMVELATPREGLHAIDLACGRGTPAIDIARQVGPSGTVLGVDLSNVVLEIARERATASKLLNVSFRTGDAEKLSGIASDAFDVATSRWGLSYMRSPKNALAEARRVLRPGATIVIAVWAEPERVPWASVPRNVLGRYCEIPTIDPESPGAFRYADTSRLERDLRAAGFAIEHVEEMTTAVIEAPNPEGIVQWVHDLGFARVAKNLGPEQTRAWEAALLRELEHHRVGEAIQLGGVTRLVVAR